MVGSTVHAGGVMHQEVLFRELFIFLHECRVSSSLNKGSLEQYHHIWKKQAVHPL
jgi:hypothetical protein